MRLIDADALKEMIPTTSVDMFENCRNCSLLSEEQVNELIDMTPTFNPWIPCSERLPDDVEIGEEYPTVIFCTKDAVCVGFYEYYRGGKWWAAEEYTVDNVIAWMPLPEAYKGGAV